MEGDADARLGAGATGDGADARGGAGATGDGADVRLGAGATGATRDAANRIEGARSGVGRIEPGDPKVTRGENYRGLPWAMLDYPRVFGREDVLAIRTMFLWGSGFSITLHLKGEYHGLYLDVIRARRAELEAAGFHLGVHPDEWRHEHTLEVFRPLGEVDDRVLGEGRFLKLSAAVGLDRWAEAPELLAGLFRTLVGVLRAH
jgi:hypothetical protein